MSRHFKPHVAAGRPVQAIEGIVPGGTEHKVLLALRGPGGMTAEQIAARFGYVSASLVRLRRKGMILMPASGQKGIPIPLTEKGRRITDHDGPLNRSQLITYCQL